MTIHAVPRQTQALMATRSSYLCWRQRKPWNGAIRTLAALKGAAVGSIQFDLVVSEVRQRLLVKALRGSYDCCTKRLMGIQPPERLHCFLGEIADDMERDVAFRLRFLGAISLAKIMAMIWNGRLLDQSERKARLQVANAHGPIEWVLSTFVHASFDADFVWGMTELDAQLKTDFTTEFLVGFLWSVLENTIKSANTGQPVRPAVTLGARNPNIVEADTDFDDLRHLANKRVPSDVNYLITSAVLSIFGSAPFSRELRPALSGLAGLRFTGQKGNAYRSHGKMLGRQSRKKIALQTKFLIRKRLRKRLLG